MISESESNNSRQALRQLISTLSDACISSLKELLSRPEKSARLADLTRDPRCKSELTKLSKSTSWFRFAWHGEVWAEVAREFAPVLEEAISTGANSPKPTSPDQLIQLLEPSDFQSEPQGTTEFLIELALEGGVLPHSQINEEQRAVAERLLQSPWASGRLALVHRVEPMIVLAPNLCHHYAKLPTVAEWILGDITNLLKLFNGLGCLGRDNLRGFRKCLTGINPTGAFAIPNLRNQLFTTCKTLRWVQRQKSGLALSSEFQSQPNATRLIDLLCQLGLELGLLSIDSQLTPLLPLAFEHLLSGHRQSLAGPASETLVMAILTDQLNLENQSFTELQSRFWPLLSPIAEQLGLVDIGLDPNGNPIAVRPSQWAQSLFQSDTRPIHKNQSFKVESQIVLLVHTTTDLNWLLEAALIGKLSHDQSPTTFTWSVSELETRNKVSSLEQLLKTAGVTTSSLNQLGNFTQRATIKSAYILRAETESLIDAILAHSSWSELVYKRLSSHELLLLERPALDSPFCLWLHDQGVAIE